MYRSILFLVVFALPNFALGSTVLALSEVELVARADVIAMGSVVHTSVYVKDKREVVTRAVLQINQHILGAEATRFLTVEVPGGELPNGLKAVTSGSPRLNVGDMVLGYFERHGDVFWPLGLSYGLLRVKLDGKGKAFVFRELDGLHLARVEPSPKTLNLLTTPEPLTAYIKRIEGITAQPVLPWSTEVRGW